MAVLNVLVRRAGALNGAALVLRRRALALVRRAAMLAAKHRGTGLSPHKCGKEIAR